MNVPSANMEEIEKLLMRLYVHKRNLQSQGIHNPVFVFFCERKDRLAVDRRFQEYMALKHYAPTENMQILSYGGATDTASIFHFPQASAAVMLFDK